MGPFMKENLKKIILKEKGNIHGLMEEVMKEIGLIIKGTQLNLLIIYRDGKGIYIWPDGKVYKGSFKNDMKND